MAIFGPEIWTLIPTISNYLHSKTYPLGFSDCFPQKLMKTSSHPHPIPIPSLLPRGTPHRHRPRGRLLRLLRAVFRTQLELGEEPAPLRRLRGDPQGIHGRCLCVFRKEEAQYEVNLESQYE